MKIAIIEDEQTHAGLLASYIRSWEGWKSSFPGILKLHTYTSAESFLFEWEDGHDFDVLFIDIQMKKMDGITLARKVRETDREVALVFTTGVAESMSEGYEVEALHYLIKPIREDKVHACLSRVPCPGKTKHFLTFRGPGNTYKFDEAAILCLEADRHNCTITVQEGLGIWHRYELLESLSDSFSKLNQDLYVKPHRSYLCSLSHIHHIEKDALFLDNGDRISVSRRMYRAVNEQFIAYYRKHTATKG